MYLEMWKWINHTPLGDAIGFLARQDRVHFKVLSHDFPAADHLNVPDLDVKSEPVFGVCVSNHVDGCFSNGSAVGRRGPFARFLPCKSYAISRIGLHACSRRLVICRLGQVAPPPGQLNARRPPLDRYRDRDRDADQHRDRLRSCSRPRFRPPGARQGAPSRVPRSLYRLAQPDSRHLLDPLDSRHLLDRLCAHRLRRKFSCRHHCRRKGTARSEIRRDCLRRMLPYRGGACGQSFLTAAVCFPSVHSVSQGNEYVNTPKPRKIRWRHYDHANQD